MLLRRMMKHVHDQNWLAVVLDFFIVVAGVVVAFQLQSWGEERAAGARAERSLHQLYEESEAALGFWVKVVRRNDERLARQDRAIGALSAGVRGELADDELVRALATMGHYPTLSPPRRSYDELTSAGLLREIDASDAMAAVADYYEEVEFIQGQITFFRPTGRAEDRILVDRLVSVYDSTRLTRRRIEVDFEQLAADATYLETLVSEFRNQLVFQAYRRGVMRDAAEMCLALAAAVGATCEGRDSYEAWRELPDWQVRSVPSGEDAS